MRRIALCVGVGLLAATSAWAQLASQTALVGTVTDSGGLVVPGAQVVAVNVGTSDTYEATTNSEGYYNIQFARPGRYEIAVTMTGFRPFKTTGVEVATNQVRRTDITLQVGAMTESVTVEAKAQVLDTDRPTVSATINEKAVVELPLPGRNVWNLAATTPGVLGGPTASSGDIGLSFRGAGQREIQNNLSLDGINATANLLAATSMRPIADAVTEIQVQTGSTSAEYGAYLGVHVNVVTKSGTNQLHGSLFHFGQDESLDSRGYFDNPALPKNPRNSKQFGGELDGPIVIPGVYNGRDRSFFMVAYEGVRGESITSPFASVPTARMRQGDFSEISTPVRNPFTRQPFPGNVIPQSMLSPTALQLLQYYPAPTLTGTSNNYQGQSAASENVDQLLVRLDHNLGNKARLSLRYNWHDSYVANAFNAALPILAFTQPRTNKNWLFGYTHTLTPNLHNDFRIGYHRLDFDTLNEFTVKGPADAGAALGIPGFDGDVRFNNPGLPSITVANVITGLSMSGTNWFQFDNTFQVSNVLAWTRGSHAIRAGFDLRRLRTGRRAANDARGLFAFTGDISGNAVADFMLGLPRTVIPPTDQIQGHVGGWRNVIFVNDVWQATRDLTLSLGLRWELNTPVQTYEGLASMLAEDFETIIPSSFPAKGFEFHEGNYADLGPRLGATYRLGTKTVLRGGFGMYYNPNQMNSFTFLTNNPPLAPVTTYTSDPANPTLSFATPSGQLGAVGRPDIISPTRELPSARKTQWSFDVQREVWNGGLVQLQYVGSDTIHLDRSFFNNTPTPGAGPVDPRRPSQKFRSRRIIANDLRADYDAVTLAVRQRMSRGLQFDLHYTWSRTRDMATHSNGGGQTMDNYDVDKDYGPANWDVPHRFVAAWVYEPTFFKNSSNKLLKYVVGGWQITGITTLQSGIPANVTFGADRANIGIAGLQRPNLIGSVPELNCQPNTGGATPAARRQLIGCYDASAFALPDPFTFGNAPRNVLRGPNYKQTDLAFMKNVPVGGDVRVQLRAEVYNVFNRANFANPNAVFGSSAFGSITSLATGATMRRIQLGAKLVF